MSAPLVQVVVVALEGAVPPIEVLPRDAQPWTDAHERAWLTLQAQSPRLHDGPIWSVVEARAEKLAVRPEQYKRLAVQAEPGEGGVVGVGDLGVRMLGVKGLLLGQEQGSGTQRLLIARRSSQTRVYQGLWELAPGGGVDVRRALSPQVILDTLAQELEEELAMTLPPACTPRAHALVIDPIALSVDILLRVDWPLPVPASGRATCAAGACATGPGMWEYADAVWISRDELRAFVGRGVHALTPPTLAVLHHIGWIEGDGPVSAVSAGAPA